MQASPSHTLLFVGHPSSAQGLRDAPHNSLSTRLVCSMVGQAQQCDVTQVQLCWEHSEHLTRVGVLRDPQGSSVGGYVEVGCLGPVASLLTTGFTSGMSQKGSACGNP